MLVFPLAFLRSFAYAGIAVVAMAALSSVVVLPAALAALGHRVDKWWVVWRQPKAVGTGFWHRVAVAVMRRPVVIAGSVVALLLVLGPPFLHIARPAGRPGPARLGSSRQVQDKIRTNFASNEAGAVSVVAGHRHPRTAHRIAYAQDLSRLPGAARVDALTGSYIDGAQVAPPNEASGGSTADDGTWFSVVPSVEPLSGDGEALVHAVRALDAPFPVEVAGPSAELVDSKAAILDRLPLAAGIIALITFVVLFLMFGSVLVPAEGHRPQPAQPERHLRGHGLDLPGGPPGRLAQLHPHRRHRHHHPDPDVLHRLRPVDGLRGLPALPDQGGVRPHGRQPPAVALGLERTGRIVTAAAALLAIVFVALATSSVSFIKLFGIGLAMAVLLDATLIRAALVPAFMRLAGDANWWAPAPCAGSTRGGASATPIRRPSRGPARRP